MEVSVEVHKIIKCTLYSVQLLCFLLQVEVLMTFGEVVVNRANYQGCQFDEHFIQCHESIEISEIVNEFVQYDQNYLQYSCIPIYPTIGDKNISRKS